MDKYMLYGYGGWAVLMVVFVILLIMKKKQEATYVFMLQFMLFMLLFTVNIIKLMAGHQ